MKSKTGNQAKGEINTFVSSGQSFVTHLVIGGGLKCCLCKNENRNCESLEHSGFLNIVGVSLEILSV